MSFSFDVKQELCRTDGENSCCKKAECYSFLLLARSFSPTGILFKTEKKIIAQRFCSLLADVCGVDVNIIPPSSDKGLFTVRISDRKVCMAVLDIFGHSGNELNLRLNRANLESDCCYAAFLRGAFLSCGNITDPEKSYHLEFNLSHKKLSDDISAVISEYITTPKMTTRRSSFVIYFKESEKIEDTLTFMGATNSSLSLMQTKIIKELRNRVNRTTNCITGNLTKTAAAVTKQLEAIEYIDSTVGLDILSDDLYEVAIFRRDNPESSLSELAELVSGGLSRSGVNHRLQSIIETARKIKQEREKT